MTDAISDRPDVVVFPPLIPLVTLLIACALQWLAPLGWIASLDPPVRIGAGLLLALAGLLATSAGRRALIRNGTNVNPSRPTTTLVTEGIFARTRNPLYLGGSIALCGIALAFALDWVFVLMFPSWIILHFAVVRREERYLERKFGDIYRHYKARVPRYFAGA